jgi:hypothetical protein
MRKRIGTVNGDANSTGLKAALDLSINHFQRSFETCKSYSGQPRWPDDASLRIDMCGGFGSLDRDAISTRLNAPLNLSIQRFPRSLYTYRKLLWPAPVARRCILGNRSPGGCGCDLVLPLGYKILVWRSLKGTTKVHYVV